MIQESALNYILKFKDADLLTTYDEKYYFNYKDEYKIIRNHYDKYKVIPDVLTVLEALNALPEKSSFKVVDTNESKTYIEQKLFEDYVYEFTRVTMNEKAGLFKVDAVRAKNELLSALVELHPPRLTYGTDIVAQAQERYDHLLDTLATPLANKFSTGLDQLDEVLGGGLHRGEEYFVIFARTNNGKSWIAEKIAVSVWEAGYNVGYFSPEMSAISVGQRFDTLYKNFSNRGVQGDDPDFNTDKYKSYINSLAKNKAKFSVTTPLDFDKEVTVTKLRKWCIDLDLKLLVIDGLTYLKNERSDGRQQETQKLTELSEDLMTLSNELSIPVIAVVQANREAARDANGEVNNDTPEIDTIRGSDGISHNASRVISVRYKDNTLTLYLNKNRYGPVGNKLIWTFQINEGRFIYLSNPKSGLATDATTDEDPNSQYDDKHSSV